MNGGENGLRQQIDNPFFEDTPVIEGSDPKEVDQGEKFLDFILTVAGVSNLGETDPIQDLHRGAGKAPTMVAFEPITGLRALR